MNINTEGSSPRKRDWSKLIFLGTAAFVLLFGSFCYGIVASRMNLPPWPTMRKAVVQVKEVVTPSDTLLRSARAPSESRIEFALPDRVAPGRVAVGGDYKSNGNALLVVLDDGRVPEIPDDKKLAWRYENQTEEGLLRI